MTSKLSPETWATIQKYIKEGYVHVKHHSKLPISIYKYSRKAEQDHFWPPGIRMCRGLVLDDNQRIVILPPPKFFNSTEPEAPNVEDYDDWEYLEKLDGYYIAIKRDSKYGLIVTSSGSFENQYTEAAEKFFSEKKLVKDVSYFCELCQNFPGDEGIIVAKYEKPSLTCWGIRPTTTGHECNVLTTETKPFESVREIQAKDVRDFLKQKVEGVVLYSPSSQSRIKLKTKWWFDIHAQIGFCTQNRIFEMMRNGVAPDFDKSFIWYQQEDIKHERPIHWDGLRLPDELRPLVSKWRTEINNAVAFVEDKAQFYYETWHFENDAQIAQNPVIPAMYKSIVFAKRHKKDYSRNLWTLAKNFLDKQQKKTTKITSSPIF